MTVNMDVKGFFYGIGWTLVVNILIVVILGTAAYFANSIPMVYSAPLRYSIILIPFAIAAIAAAMLSFVPYFGVPPFLRFLPLIGIGLSGYAMSLFFQGFTDNYAERIEQYVDRVDQLTILILLFSLITAACSGAKLGQVWKLPQDKNTKLEDLRLYWGMKLLICDVPILVGASILLFIQEGTLNMSSQAFNEVYLNTVQAMLDPKGTVPFDFEVADVQRQFSNANFWFGVAMGVTSAQLIMQQLSSLFLEWTLHRR